MSIWVIILVAIFLLSYFWNTRAALTSDDSYLSRFCRVLPWHGDQVHYNNSNNHKKSSIIFVTGNKPQTYKNPLCCARTVRKTENTTLSSITGNAHARSRKIFTDHWICRGRKWCPLFKIWRWRSPSKATVIYLIKKKNYFTYDVVWLNIYLVYCVNGTIYKQPPLPPPLRSCHVL